MQQKYITDVFKIAISGIVTLTIVYFAELLNFPFYHWFRLSFLIPIIYAGYLLEINGAVFVAMMVNVFYVPLIAGSISKINFAEKSNLLFTIIFINIIGIIAGKIAGSERKARVRAELLLSISIKIHSVFDRKVILKNLLESLFSLIEVEEGLLLLCQNSKLVPAIILTDNEKNKDEVEKTDFNHPLGLCLKVFKEENFVASNILLADKRFAQNLDIGYHNLMILPLKVKDKTVGVIRLANKRAGNVFTKNDLYLSQTVIHSAENALHNVELHQELKETQQTLLQSEKLAAMGELAAGIAHEINTPLGTVIGYSQMLLRKEKDNKENIRILKIVEEESQRCSNIVKGLLNFSHEISLNLQTVNLNDLLLKTISLTEYSYKKINIIKEFSVDLPLVLADYDQLKQVFLNIISNSISAMSEGDILTIKTYFNEKNIFLEFIDTGCGIAEENLKKIFKPFFTTKPSGEGTGLGLAISLRIIEAHQGSIEVQSKIQEGTKFIIKIPLK